MFWSCWCEFAASLTGSAWLWINQVTGEALRWIFWVTGNVGEVTWKECPAVTPGAVQILSSSGIGALCCPETFPTLFLLVLECSLSPGEIPAFPSWIPACKAWTKPSAHDLLSCCADQQGLCNNSGALWHLLFTQSSSLLPVLLVTQSPIRSDSRGRLLDIMSKKIICPAGRWVFAPWISHPESWAV